MKVALTGANGFIGSHILTELQQHGHEVTALVRNDAQAGTAAGAGATPVVIDLYPVAGPHEVYPVEWRSGAVAQAGRYPLSNIQLG
jgi:nucleoside-diphosphate-sugar epimerase